MDLKTREHISYLSIKLTNSDSKPSMMQNMELKKFFQSLIKIKFLKAQRL